MALEAVAQEVVVLDTTFPLIIAVSLPRMQFAIRSLIIGLWSWVEAFLSNSYADILQEERVVEMEAVSIFPRAATTNSIPRARESMHYTRIKFRCYTGFSSYGMH